MSKERTETLMHVGGTSTELWGRKLILYSFFPSSGFNITQAPSSMGHTIIAQSESLPGLSLVDAGARLGHSLDFL